MRWQRTWTSASDVYGKSIRRLLALVVAMLNLLMNRSAISKEISRRQDAGPL